MRKRIGEFLVEKGVLSEAQVQEILKYSQRTGLRFGEAGMEMGLLTREKMIQVFGPSFAVTFFHVEPSYYPEVTRELFPVEAMFRMGALPLGFKTEHRFFRARKMLNVGFLDPARQDAAAEAERLARARLGEGGIHGIRPFLILPDQFLAVAEKVYGVTQEQVLSGGFKDMDGTLGMFLDHVVAGKA